MCAALSGAPTGHPQSIKLLHRSTGNLDVAAGQVAVPRPQYWCRAATAIEPTAPNRPRHSRPWRCRRPSRPHARCQLCRHSSHGVAAVRSIASKEHVVAICLSPPTSTRASSLRNSTSANHRLPNRWLAARHPLAWRAAFRCSGSLQLVTAVSERWASTRTVLGAWRQTPPAPLT